MMNKVGLLLCAGLLMVGCGSTLDRVSQGSHEVSMQFCETLRTSEAAITPALDEVQSQLTIVVQTYEIYYNRLLQENPTMAEKIKESRELVVMELEKAISISSSTKLRVANELQQLNQVLLQSDNTTQSLIGYIRLWTARKQ